MRVRVKVTERERVWKYVKNPTWVGDFSDT